MRTSAYIEIREWNMQAGNSFSHGQTTNCWLKKKPTIGQRANNSGLSRRAKLLRVDLTPSSLFAIQHTRTRHKNRPLLLSLVLMKPVNTIAAQRCYVSEAFFISYTA